MNTSILNIKTDPETKEKLKAFAAQLGLPVSALMNAQIKQMLRNGRVEFNTVTAPTPYLESIIEKAEVDRIDGKIKGPFKTSDELLADLNN